MTCAVRGPCSTLGGRGASVCLALYGSAYFSVELISSVAMRPPVGKCSRALLRNPCRISGVGAGRAGRTTQEKGRNILPLHKSIIPLYTPAYLECDALTCAFTKRMRVGGNGATF